MSNQYKEGDWLIYKKQKRSRRPGPRARSIAAAVQNDNFSYVVDKFWIVQQVHPDGMIEAKTRRGKVHLIDPNDPNLRRANWWQRLRYRGRFHQVLKDVEHVS